MTKKFNTENKGIINQFNQSLFCLSYEIDKQETLFPSFACVTCELFSDFDNFYTAINYRDYFDKLYPNNSKIKKLHKLLTGMPKSDFVCFDVKMLKHKNWNKVRTLAGEIIFELKLKHMDVKNIEISHGIYKQIIS